jgi:hypothetical protein
VNTFARWIAGLSSGAAILAGAWWLVSHGVYGLTLLLIVPTLLGAMTAAISRPPTATHAGVAGACAAVFGSVALYGLHVQGGISIVMMLPFGIPGGVIGGWLVYLFQSCLLES